MNRWIRMPSLRPRMRSEDARTNPILLLERAAEVRGIVKSPEKRDFRDALSPQVEIGEVTAALAEPPLANPIRDGAALTRENPVHVSHRNAHRRSDFRGT